MSPDRRGSEPSWHYLDYAATAAIRPTGVADAVHAFLSEVGTAITTAPLTRST